MKNTGAATTTPNESTNYCLHAFRIRNTESIIHVTIVWLS